MPPEPSFEPRLVQVGNAGPYTGAGNNTWLITAGGTSGLVDAGIGNDAHLDAVAAALEAQHSTLEQVLVTHAHQDHAAGAPALARRLGVRRFRKFTWPEHDVDGVAWQHVEDGATLDVAEVTLTALHTPGHAPDHLAFWHQDSGVMFTGDLVNAASSVAIIQSRGGDLVSYLASLERLLALQPARLLPGHGPIIEHPVRLLTATLAHRRRRDEQVAAAVAAGHATVQAIANSIYDGLAPELMPLARENVRAHLEKLTREGRVVCETVDARSSAATAADDIHWRPARP